MILVSLLITTIMAIDPEIQMNASEIIAHWGYPVEEHSATTDDGYILGLQRIPYGKNESPMKDSCKPVVLLVHGLLLDSTTFISNLPNQSAAFLFADAGFDVWLGNVRGNTYSRKHTTFSKNAKEFWDYSWVEHAFHDLPAMIDTVLNITERENLYYVGYSQGTLMVFTKLSVDPVYGKKIKKFYALSPIGSVSHVQGIAPILALTLPDAQASYMNEGSHMFMGDTNYNRVLAATICSNEIGVQACSQFLSLFCGTESSDQLNLTRTAVYVSHNPSGSSWKNMVHWGQMIVHGVTSHFDYGPQENERRYGVSTPPPFNFTTVATDMHIFHSDDDILSDKIDNHKYLFPSLNRQYVKIFLTLVMILPFVAILIRSVMAGDPEVHMTASQIITHWGYPVEEVSTVTEDGYILGLQRIPHGKNESYSKKTTRPAVLMIHGLLCDSTNFIANLPNQSAGFLFADAGFDVWLGNVRGNTYSRNHKTLDTEAKQFWEYSWVEHALYDLPAMIDTILNQTGQESLYYVGHSQGSLMLFAKLSLDPEYGTKIRKHFALSPIGTVAHIKGLFPKLANLVPEYEILYILYGSFKFGDNNNFYKFMAETVCANPIGANFCGEFMFLLSGPDPGCQFNMSRIPVYISQNPSGTSWKNMIHWGQMVVHGVTSQFDYGPRGNTRKYGMPVAPSFNFSTIKTDVHLFYSDDDYLANPIDIHEYLIPSLNPRYVKSVTNVRGYNHLDFIWGLHAAEEIYKKIIGLIKSDFGDIEQY